MGEVAGAGKFSRTRRTRVKWHGLYALWWSRHVGPRRKVNGRADTNADANTHANTNTYANADTYSNRDAYSNSCAR